MIKSRKVLWWLREGLGEGKREKWMRTSVARNRRAAFLLSSFSPSSFSSSPSSSPSPSCSSSSVKWCMWRGNAARGKMKWKRSKEPFGASLPLFGKSTSATRSQWLEHFTLVPSKGCFSWPIQTLMLSFFTCKELTTSKSTWAESLVRRISKLESPGIMRTRVSSEFLKGSSTVVQLR